MEITSVKDFKAVILREFCSCMRSSMAVKGSNAAATLFILFNITFSTCLSSHSVPCPPKGQQSPPPAPKKPAKCPKDTLKFGVCGSWLGLVYENVGTRPSKKCCALVAGLAELEAALCLCTAIKANVLGVLKPTVPVALSLVVNSCGKKVPQGFQCT